MRHTRTSHGCLLSMDTGQQQTRHTGVSMKCPLSICAISRLCRSFYSFPFFKLLLLKEKNEKKKGPFWTRPSRLSAGSLLHTEEHLCWWQPAQSL